MKRAKRRMSLDRAIATGKEHRKPYRGSRAFDTGCRNHGSCAHCTRARTIDRLRTQMKARDALREGHGIG